MATRLASIWSVAHGVRELLAQARAPGGGHVAPWRPDETCAKWNASWLPKVCAQVSLRSQVHGDGQEERNVRELPLAP